MKLTSPLALAISFILGASSLVSNAAPIADQKIGTVDLQKIFATYYKTERSTRALKQEASEMQKEQKEMIESGKKQQDEWQKLIDKSEDQAISAEERARAKKAAEDKFREVKNAEQMVQEFDRVSSAKLREKERQRHDDIVKEIRTMVNAEAKLAGYTLVFDTSGNTENTVPAVLFSTGVNDLTDNVIKALNAGAPTPLPDEKDSKDIKTAK